MRSAGCEEGLPLPAPRLRRCPAPCQGRVGNQIGSLEPQHGERHDDGALWVGTRPEGVAGSGERGAIRGDDIAGMRDEVPKDVQRVLAQRVANRCSNPDCGAITSGLQEDESKAVNLGVAAQITAASPGGPRFDPALSAEQRRAPGNGMWLCQNCAKKVDNDLT